MDAKWIIAERSEKNLIDQVLVNRGVNLRKKERFFHPRYPEDLGDPQNFIEMDRAIERLYRAMKHKEKVLIVGDFDADGIPGAALLTEFLQAIKVECEVYLPSRAEGYGFKKAHVLLARKNKATLIITVDCGVTAVDETAFAKKAGIDCIILDHHELQTKLPRAAAVINPQHPKNRRPIINLAATAVAWHFAFAYFKKYNLPNEATLKWLLDLAGIATICDMVPLKDENRAFAQYGLKVLQKTRRIGLKALMREASRDPHITNTYDVGFVIGPRLNAMGRMEHPLKSYELLITKDKDEAEKIAAQLEKNNAARQAALKLALQKALLIVEKEQKDRYVLVVYHPQWHPGIIGLVASRLAEQYHRPAFVLTRVGGELKGSARSTQRFHLTQALKKVEKTMQAFGGHARAAGITLAPKNLKKFSLKIEALGRDLLRKEDLLPTIVVDARAKPADFTDSFVRAVEQCAPFGVGNPRPVFMLENVRLKNMRPVGQQQAHLKAEIDGHSAIAFNHQTIPHLQRDGTLDILVTAKMETWQNQTAISLHIVEARPSQAALPI